MSDLYGHVIQYYMTIVHAWIYYIPLLLAKYYANFWKITMKGLSINSFNLSGQSFPLIWGGDAANYSAGADPIISKYCFPGFMNWNKVQGKIVLCENPGDGTFGDGTGILIGHGVGTIISDPSIIDFAFSYPLPAKVINTEDGLQILDYIRTTE